MKKLLLILITLSACNAAPGIDGNEFLGKWKISESSPSYSEQTKKMFIEITKKDIFFWVVVKMDGKDILEEFGKISSTDSEKEISEKLIKASHQFQLSPDKQTIIPLSGMSEFTMAYHADNGTMQNMWGWFEKE
ncbi:MAG: hypothetical protein ABIT08_02450 [Bacteroidia bacterium]